MKDVDQATGKDLNPHSVTQTGKAKDDGVLRNPDRPVTLMELTKGMEFFNFILFIYYVISFLILPTEIFFTYPKIWNI